MVQRSPEYYSLEFKAARLVSERIVSLKTLSLLALAAICGVIGNYILLPLGVKEENENALV